MILCSIPNCFHYFASYMFLLSFCLNINMFELLLTGTHKYRLWGGPGVPGGVPWDPRGASRPMRPPKAPGRAEGRWASRIHGNQVPGPPGVTQGVPGAWASWTQVPQGPMSFQGPGAQGGASGAHFRCCRCYFEFCVKGCPAASY